MAFLRGHGDSTEAEITKFVDWAEQLVLGYELVKGCWEGRIEADWKDGAAEPVFRNSKVVSA